MRNLVVIVEEKESRGTRDLPREWFTGAKGTRGEYTIETPLGEERTIRGTLLETFDLSYVTSEFFYLDLTRTCNYKCAHCGIKKDIVAKKIEKDPYDITARYVTPDFIEGVAKSIFRYPTGVIGDRSLFYGGGEPLINPVRFGEINHAFESVQSTTRIVVTNGLALPIDEQEFVRFMEGIGNPHIMLTYTESHAKQYASLADPQRGFSRWVPTVDRGQALIEKIKLLSKICEKHNLSFGLNIVYPNGKFAPEELRTLILENAIRYVNTDMDGVRDPCSRSRETAIRFNGDIYPHCYDVFSGKNQLGVIGFLIR